MGSANSPSRHHYVPVAYLRHFTDTGEIRGVLDAIEWAKSHQRSTNLRHIGWSRNHFSALDADGKVVSTLVETLRANFEGTVAPAFARAARGEADPEALAAIVTLATLLHVGAPRLRTVMQAALAQAVATGRTIEAALLAGEGRMPPTVAGADDPPGMLLTDLECALAENGVHNQLAAFGVDGLPVVQSYLARRHWTLFVAGSGAGQFLTTDAPLVCDWAVTPPPIGLFGPSIADPRAVVLLPVSKRAIAFGRHEPAPPRREVDRQFVATVNFALLRALTRQAYLPPGDVPCLSLIRAGCIVDARTAADEAQRLRKSVGRQPTASDATNWWRRD